MYDFESGTGQSFDAGDYDLLVGATEASFHSVCKLESSGAHRYILGLEGTGGQVRFYMANAGVNLVPVIPKLIVSISGDTARCEGNVPNGFPVGQDVRFGARFKIGDVDGMGVYMNGVRQDISLSDTSLWVATAFVPIAANVYIGQRSLATTERWDGIIGETAIWDVFLGSQEFASLEFMSALAVRPDRLVFYWDGHSPVAWLPKQNLFITMTPIGTPGPVFLEDTYMQEEVGWEEEEFANVVSSAYGPWEILPARPTTNSFRDVDVVNGTTYQYKVRAKDFSGNESADSGPSADLTPVGGIPQEGGQPQHRGDKVMKARRYRQGRGYRWNRG